MWLYAAAKQNKSGNSGRRERRVEGARAALRCGREAERRLEASWQRPQNPQRDFTATGPSFPSTAEGAPSGLSTPNPTLERESTGHRGGLGKYLGN